MARREVGEALLLGWAKAWVAERKARSPQEKFHYSIGFPLADSKGPATFYAGAGTVVNYGTWRNAASFRDYVREETGNNRFQIYRYVLVPD